ncbi:hypothetical protein [Umezawaea sp. NPDC059074]|uniref:hypothetical protein n=1 Tax=Umezawaea sp. NPDC059074 TaxID=3346716 RepID=UPI0036A705EA
MTTTSFDLDQPLTLHPITYLDEGDEVTLGRANSDNFGVFPADGAALLRRLEAGLTPREAQLWYAEEYGEPVDIVEFLEVVEEFDLLAPAGEVAQAPPEVRWRGLGRAVFSPVAWVLYAAVVIAALVAMARDSALVPHFRNIFFTDSLIVLQLGIFFGQIPLILFHEGFHALAGRRLGINSTLRIGRRFYFIVFETSLDGLVSVSRSRRYLPILAGMIADVLVISALTLGAAVTDGWVSAVCRAFAFVTVLRLYWQFYFFLRTDLYYLVTTVLRCDDLQSVAGQMLRNRLYRLLGRHDRLFDETAWGERDRAVGRWYSWVLLAGYGFLVVMLAVAVVPAMLVMLGIVISRFQGHPTVLNTLDSLVFLTLSIGQFVFAGVLAHRARRARR